MNKTAETSRIKHVSHFAHRYEKYIAVVFVFLSDLLAGLFFPLLASEQAGAAHLHWFLIGFVLVIWFIAGGLFFAALNLGFYFSRQGRGGKQFLRDSFELKNTVGVALISALFLILLPLAAFSLEQILAEAMYHTGPWQFDWFRFIFMALFVLIVVWFLRKFKPRFGVEQHKGEAPKRKVLVLFMSLDRDQSRLDDNELGQYFAMPKWRANERLPNYLHQWIGALHHGEKLARIYLIGSRDVGLNKRPEDLHYSAGEFCIQRSKILLQYSHVKNQLIKSPEVDLFCIEGESGEQFEVKFQATCLDRNDSRHREIENALGVDFENVNEIEGALDAVITHAKKDGKFSDADIVIDITGGQKPTSAVATIFTFGREIIVQYVQTNHPFKVVAYNINPQPAPHQ